MGVVLVLMDRKQAQEGSDLLMVTDLGRDKLVAFFTSLDSQCRLRPARVDFPCRHGALWECWV